MDHYNSFCCKVCEDKKDPPIVSKANVIEDDEDDTEMNLPRMNDDASIGTQMNMDDEDNRQYVAHRDKLTSWKEGRLDRV